MQVNVEMDEGWRWWFNYQGSPLASYSRRPYTFEVPEELVRRAEAAAKEYYAVQEQLEQLYRIQEGIEPWQSTPIPEHTRCNIPSTPTATS